MQVQAFQHAPLEGIGSIAGALDRRRIACRTVDVGQTTRPVDLSDAAGLILMGGPMSANDDLPWVPREIDMLPGNQEPKWNSWPRDFFGRRRVEWR